MLLRLTIPLMTRLSLLLIPIRLLIPVEELLASLSSPIKLARPVLTLIRTLPVETSAMTFPITSFVRICPLLDVPSTLLKSTSLPTLVSTSPSILLTTDDGAEVFVAMFVAPILVNYLG